MVAVSGQQSPRSLGVDGSTFFVGSVAAKVNSFNNNNNNGSERRSSTPTEFPTPNNRHPHSTPSPFQHQPLSRQSSSGRPPPPLLKAAASAVDLFKPSVVDFPDVSAADGGGNNDDNDGRDGAAVFAPPPTTSPGTVRIRLLGSSGAYSRFSTTSVCDVGRSDGPVVVVPDLQVVRQHQQQQQRRRQFVRQQSLVQIGGGGHHNNNLRRPTPDGCSDPCPTASSLSSSSDAPPTSALSRANKDGGRYKSCRNLSTPTSSGTSATTRRNQLLCPQHPSSPAAFSNDHSAVIKSAARSSVVRGGSDGNNEVNWTEESFKEYLAELHTEYGALKGVLTRALIVGANCKERQLDVSTATSTSDQLSVCDPSSSESAIITVVRNPGEGQQLSSSSSAEAAEKIRQSVAKMDELLRRVANLNAVLGNSRLAEVSIREKMRAMGDRELHLTKMIEEQSGLVELAKRKVARMAKEAAEERRRRKDCEKRSAEENQDLKEQNELLEFRLLELDAWKQQHQSFFDEAKTDVIQRLEIVAHQTSTDWSFAVFGFDVCDGGRDEEDGFDADPDSEPGRRSGSFLAPSDEFAAQLLDDASSCTAADFGRLWRVAVSFLDYVETALSVADRNYREIQSENARIQDELAEARAGQYPDRYAAAVVSDQDDRRRRPPPPPPPPTLSSDGGMKRATADSTNNCGNCAAAVVGSTTSFCRCSSETGDNNEMAQPPLTTELDGESPKTRRRPESSSPSPSSDRDDAASTTMSLVQQHHHHHHHHHEQQSSSLSDAQSFQESGIFDGASVSESTQTDEFDGTDVETTTTTTTTTAAVAGTSGGGCAVKRKLVKSKPKVSTTTAATEDSDGVAGGSSSSSSSSSSPMDDGDGESDDDEDGGGVGGNRTRRGNPPSTLLRRIQAENTKLSEEADRWRTHAGNLSDDVRRLERRIGELETSEAEARKSVERLESRLRSASSLVVSPTPAVQQPTNVHGSNVREGAVAVADRVSTPSSPSPSGVQVISVNSSPANDNYTGGYNNANSSNSSTNGNNIIFGGADDEVADWCCQIVGTDTSRVTVIKLGSAAVSPNPFPSSSSPSSSPTCVNTAAVGDNVFNGNNRSNTPFDEVSVSASPSPAPSVTKIEVNSSKVLFRVNCGDNDDDDEFDDDSAVRLRRQSPSPPGVTSISVVAAAEDGSSCDDADDHRAAVAAAMVTSSPTPTPPPPSSSHAGSAAAVGAAGQSATVRCRPGTAQDREKFYLGKIKALQAERNQLRKDAEREKQKALAARDQLADSLRDGQCKLETLATTLSQVQVAKDDLEYRFSVEKAELDRKLREVSNQGDVWRSECKILAEKCDNLEAELGRSREYAESVESSCASLRDLAHLWHVLGIAEEDVVDDGAGDVGGSGVCEDGGPPSDNNNKSSAENPPPSKMMTAAGGRADGAAATSSSAAERGEERLVDKYVRGIRARVAEMQKKDAAYQQTLREADKIVADVEQRYKLQIADLQTDERKLKTKMASLEQLCDQLRHALGLAGTAAPTAAIDKEVMSLLARLVDSENNAMKLKEQLFDMEKVERASSIKIMELEKKIAELKSELRDQEELISRINQLSQDNAQLQADNNLLAPVRRQLAEVRSKNKLLESRVEELEEAERTLQQTLDQATSVLKSRDTKHQAEVASMNKTIEQTKSELESRESEERRWKSEAQSLKEQLAARDLEARRKGEMLTSMEESHRGEISRLRSQLRGAKEHLQRVDATNLGLQDELRAMSEQLVALQGQLQREEHRYERSLLQLNLQLVSKDDQIQELGGQLRDAKESLARMRELDRLADVDNGGGGGGGRHAGGHGGEVDGDGDGVGGIAELQRRISVVVANIKNCGNCSTSERANLEKVAAQVTQLAAIIRGSGHSPSGDSGCCDVSVTSTSSSSSSGRPHEPGPSSASSSPPPGDGDQPLLDQSRRTDSQLLLLPLSLGEEMMSHSAFSDGGGDVDALRRQVESLREKLQQAEEEGAVLANQLRRAKEDLLQEKEESARLLVEVANRKKRQSEASDGLRRENAALRDEVGHQRQEMAELQFQVRQLQQILHELEQHQQHVASGNKPHVSSRRMSGGGGNVPIMFRQQEMLDEDRNGGRGFNSLPPPTTTTEMTSPSSLLAPIAEVEDYMRSISVRQQQHQQQSRTPSAPPTAGAVSNGQRSSKRAARTNSMPSDASSPYAVAKSLSTSAISAVSNGAKRGTLAGFSRIPKPLPAGALKRSHSMSVKSCAPSNHPAVQQKASSFHHQTSSPYSDEGRSDVATPTSPSASASGGHQHRWRSMSSSASPSSSYSCSSPLSMSAASAAAVDVVAVAVPAVATSSVSSFSNWSSSSSASSGSSGPNSLEDDLHLHTHQQQSKHQHLQQAAARQQDTTTSNNNNNNGNGKHKLVRRRATLAAADCQEVLAKSAAYVDFNGNTSVPKLSSGNDRVCSNLSPPEKFRVTRFVGDDGVLLAWEPPLDTRVAGYKIYVDGEFNSKVRSPQRTKALVNGIRRLKLPGALVVLEIRSIGIDGGSSVSPPAVARVTVPPPPETTSSSELGRTDRERRHTLPSDVSCNESSC